MIETINHIVSCKKTSICYVCNKYAGRRMEVQARFGSDPYAFSFIRIKIIVAVIKVLHELKLYDKANAFTLYVNRFLYKIDVFGKSVCDIFIGGDSND